jgi:hypothetical protein
VIAVLSEIAVASVIAVLSEIADAETTDVKSGRPRAPSAKGRSTSSSVKIWRMWWSRSYSVSIAAAGQSLPQR